MQKKFTLIFVLILGGLIFLTWFGWVKLDKNQELLEPEQIEEEVKEESVIKEVVGYSVEGRKIEAYTFGRGSKTLLFVGGIHGGYEWNSVILAYRFIDYFTATPALVPDDLKIVIIPALNPDGVYKVVGIEGRFLVSDVPANGQELGRFNANQVDLNRNFSCRFKPESTWRGKVVSAGEAPFSEPEARALKNLVEKIKPQAVIFWHSQASAVYASECGEGILPETLAITNLYAKASGYKAIETFDAYPVTGDAESWLASINIPAITVELTSHETIEWEQNLAGVKALFNYY